MTGSERSSSGLDARRRKLLFRSWHRGIGLDARRRKLLFLSWHRGMREMDLNLGSFADASIDALTDAQLDQYEKLLDISDTVLLPLATGEQPIPSGDEYEILQTIVAFRHTVKF
jgi:antitoxin CptB